MSSPTESSHLCLKTLQWIQYMVSRGLLGPGPSEHWGVHIGTSRGLQKLQQYSTLRAWNPGTSTNSTARWPEELQCIEVKWPTRGSANLHCTVARCMASSWHLPLVCRLPYSCLPPACHLPATCMLPACHLIASCQQPACNLSTSCLPPTCHLSAAYQLTATFLLLAWNLPIVCLPPISSLFASFQQTSCGLPALCHLLATYLQPACHLPVTFLLPIFTSLPPVSNPPATCLPSICQPAFHPPTSCALPAHLLADAAYHLPAACLSSACSMSATYLPPVCRQPASCMSATCLLPACRLPVIACHLLFSAKIRYMLSTAKKIKTVNCLGKYKLCESLLYSRLKVLFFLVLGSIHKNIC